MSYTEIYTNMSNVDTLQEILALANTNSGGAFWTGMYWMIILILLLSTQIFGFEASMIIAFFGGLIIGLPLLYLGLINVVVFGITCSVLIFAVIYLIYSSNKYN